MWTGFNLFTELNITNSQSVGAVLQDARRETLRWLKSHACGVKRSYLKRRFVRSLAKRDKMGKIADLEMVFEQTLKLWIANNNVDVKIGGLRRPRVRVRFVSF
jgi:uncharacterized protein with ATP-grasp and redox domains